MLDPAELLAVAGLLSAPRAQKPPSQAQLRRAVSTAYYALFHKVLQAAAERFVGLHQQNSGAYNILYRSFDHGYMKKVCDDLQLSTLKDRTKIQLHRSSISQDARDFAGSFPALQEVRHAADYDPTAQFLRSVVVSLVDGAAVAVAAFDRMPPDEKADILALLMVRSKY